jgi:hypothetical protein
LIGLKALRHQITVVGVATSAEFAWQLAAGLVHGWSRASGLSASGLRGQAWAPPGMWANTHHCAMPIRPARLACVTSGEAIL